jgi:hypothetical protein
MTDHIFPTLSRGKHSKLQSYPIGAKALSRALEGVPQHNQIGCTFYAQNPKADKNKDKIYVMSVLYEKHGRTFHHSEDADARGVFDPRWSINVYAVAAGLRHEVNAALMDVGLPDFVAPWLIANANLIGQTGGSVLWLEYDLIQKCLLATYRDGLEPERA